MPTTATEQTTIFQNSDIGMKAKTTAKKAFTAIPHFALFFDIPFYLFNAMPLEFQDSRHLEVAHGYIELAMWEEANEQLEAIDAFCRTAPEVLAARIEIYRGLKKWELMREIAKRLNECDPENVQWIISYAFASRRALSIEVAKEILLKAVSKFPKEAIIYFNLACYDCQLGRIESAKDYLKRAFEIDSNWRNAALDDEDLEPIWNSL
jgi:tetratricopeptide (TPR) repeat protein